MSARPDEAVIRLRESNRRICCFRGGEERGRKFVRLPVIMSPLTSRFFTRAYKFLCSRGLRPV